MTINTHTRNDSKIAEVISADMIINNVEDGEALLGNLYYKHFTEMIIYEKNITPEFFDLKSGIAGEILQKYSNYRLRLQLLGIFRNIQVAVLMTLLMKATNGSISTLLIFN